MREYVPKCGAFRMCPGDASRSQVTVYRAVQGQPSSLDELEHRGRRERFGYRGEGVQAYGMSRESRARDPPTRPRTPR